MFTLSTSGSTLLPRDKGVDRVQRVLQKISIFASRSMVFRFYFFIFIFFYSLSTHQIGKETCILHFCFCSILLLFIVLGAFMLFKTFFFSIFSSHNNLF